MLPYSVPLFADIYPPCQLILRLRGLLACCICTSLSESVRVCQNLVSSLLSDLRRICPHCFRVRVPPVTRDALSTARLHVIFSVFKDFGELQLQCCCACRTSCVHAGRPQSTCAKRRSRLQVASSYRPRLGYERYIAACCSTTYCSSSPAAKWTWPRKWGGTRWGCCCCEVPVTCLFRNSVRGCCAGGLSLWLPPVWAIGAFHRTTSAPASNVLRFCSGPILRNHRH